MKRTIRWCCINAIVLADLYCRIAFTCFFSGDGAILAWNKVVAVDSTPMSSRGGSELYKAMEFECQTQAVKAMSEQRGRKIFKQNENDVSRKYDRYEIASSRRLKKRISTPVTKK